MIFTGDFTNNVTLAHDRPVPKRKKVEHFFFVDVEFFLYVSSKIRRCMISSGKRENRTLPSKFVVDFTINCRDSRKSSLHYFVLHTYAYIKLQKFLSMTFFIVWLFIFFFVFCDEINILLSLIFVFLVSHGNWIASSFSHGALSILKRERWNSTVLVMQIRSKSTFFFILLLPRLKPAHTCRNNI